jgi:diguanylate cyclase (GGDEF)-like protein
MPLLRKILVVDDNRINRRILCKVLGKEYDTIEAENGEEALELLRESYDKISAVLLDIVMPVMDGYEVLRQMHADRFLSQIPVIVMTGDDAQDTEVKALSLGAHDFLVKPYKPAIIMHRLANTINLRETAALVNAVEKDALTGVYSKEFFYKKAEIMLAEGYNKKYDIICIDIERFKLINDLFGIRIGDDLLKYIGKILGEEVKANGICGRVGVDKFACMVPHREDYAMDTFRGQIERINQFPINISIAVRYGIYQIDDLTIPLNVMCDRALIACNSIKGKYDIYYAFYNDKFREKLISEQIMIDNMSNALTERQFQVYYQPKYNLQTEMIAGAEALVRWIHPEKGFMSPGEFIPLFERNGFITDLDIYVWETVCQDIRAWSDAGIQLVPISVNVSRADIYNPCLADILIGLIKKYDIDINYLHLEVTETAYTENPDQIISTVTKLRSLGFVIEMDDFGTGYSSLNMLSELPIQILKLDMKFIQNETEKKNNKSILGFVVSLAKWLNLLVVAEGVETLKQAEILRELSCDFAQGFYYARPLPRESFEKSLREEEQKRLNKKACALDTKKDTPAELKKMIIIDDIEADRETLAEFFGTSFQIEKFCDIRKAYACIEENSDTTAVIMLNLFMEKQYGFELFSKLHENERLANIPLIVTSPSEAGCEAKALGMGAAEFISKPYNRDVAVYRVNNVMMESRLLILERERELAREIENVKYKVEHDSMTGLYNRFALENIGNKFFEENKNAESVLMLLAINDFDKLNNTFGHDKMDRLINALANKVSGFFREGDTVARISTEGFAIFIPSAIALSDIKRRAVMVCRQMSAPFEGIHLLISMGIAIAPEHGEDYQTLFRHAESALMEATLQSGEQYRIYNEEFTKKLSNHLAEVLSTEA